MNLLEPGDTAIVAVTGFFGNRIARMAERTGAKVVEVRADYGQIAPNEALLDAIDANPGARLVAVVHAETSTGVRHPVEELGRELKRRDSDTLLFVDCVTSLGAHPVEFDAWGFDYAYSCTQKALAAPPGMSPIAISDRALERVAARKTPVPFTFDLDLLRRVLDRPADHVPPHGADPPHLRAARGAPRRPRRGPREPLPASRRRRRATSRTRSAAAASSCSPTPSTSSRSSPPCASPRGSTARTVQGRVL